MFNFTTTTVINSKEGLLQGDQKYVHIEKDGEVVGVRIAQVGTFMKDNIVAIYKAKSTDGQKEKVEINLANITGVNTGDLLQLELYISLTQASQQSIYSNDYQHKGKPIVIDFTWNGTDTAKKLADNIKKFGLAVYGEKLFTVTVTGNKLTITAVDNFQRFTVVNVNKYNAPSIEKPMGEYVNKLSLDSSDVTLTPGVESFGDYSYILHNLRIPTFENTRAYSPNAVEMPIPGAKYNQYTIHYCVKRGQLGMNAVGEVTKSMTTHVFYVNTDVCEDFETCMTEIGTLEEVPAKEDDKD